MRSDSDSDSNFDFEEYFPVLQRMAREYRRRRFRSRFDDADVTQEAAIAAFERLQTLRGSTFAERFMWLQSITSHRFLNLLRYHSRARRNPSREVALRADDSLASCDTPSAIVSRKEVRALLFRAVYSLPTRSREVIILHKVLGLSRVQTAEILDVPPSTVSGRLQRGVKQLRQKLHHLEF